MFEARPKLLLLRTMPPACRPGVVSHDALTSKLHQLISPLDLTRTLQEQEGAGAEPVIGDGNTHRARMRAGLIEDAARTGGIMSLEQTYNDHKKRGGHFPGPAPRGQAPRM
jgi:hypothetical protein